MLVVQALLQHTSVLYCTVLSHLDSVLITRNIQSLRPCRHVLIVCLAHVAMLPNSEATRAINVSDRCSCLIDFFMPPFPPLPLMVSPHSSAIPLHYARIQVQ